MGHGVRNADERECTLTIDILLQNDRKRAKQMYDEAVHVRQYRC